MTVFLFVVGLTSGASDGRTIKADDILARIQARDRVEYDGVTISGDLDIDRLEHLPTVKEDNLYLEPHDNLYSNKKLVESIIKITNSTIRGRVNFSNTIFNKSVDFNGTLFLGYAGFRGAHFREETNWSNVRFFQYADFLGSEFIESVTFGNTEFKDYADFEDAHFEDYVNFSSRFMNTADFKYTQFNNDVEFDQAEFNDEAYFCGAGFNGYANFQSAHFNGYANFQSAHFNGNADFNLSYYSKDNGGIGDKCTEFNGYTDFEEAQFNSTAGFEGAKFKYISLFRDTKFQKSVTFFIAEFNESADFARTEFNGDANFEFTKQKRTLFRNARFNSSADFSSAELGWANFIDTKFNEPDFSYVQFKGDAVFENATFQKELSLSKARYEKLYMRWDSLKSGLVYDDTAYMSLMKNFKDLGYFEDYDSCYYAYRVAHREVPWPSVPNWEEIARKAIDCPLDWFYGYGTKPFNAFFISLFIILAFAVFWWAIGISGPNDRTGASLKDGDDWLDGDITDILGYSTTVFLSGTKFFVDPPAQPKIEGISKPMIKWAFIIERTLGALFSVMFFMAISSTIVRS